MYWRKKFNWQNWQILYATNDIRENGTIVTPRKVVNIIKENNKDNLILECALESRAEYIVSGERNICYLWKNFAIVWY